jgi:rhamnogalacturonan endolyase
MSLVHLFLAAASLYSFALAAFGITETSSSYVVDAGSSNSLKIIVNRATCDITSIVYRGEELQYKSQGTHLSSGLGSATVTSQILNGEYAKITCTTATVTQYIVVKSGDSNVYLATHTTKEPDIGELRFIARLDASRIPLEYPYGVVSTTAGSSSTVEGSDVFVVNGQTRSKFYSSERFIDDKIHCIYRDGDNPLRACMVLPDPAYEASSGGPFFRDINTNNGGAFNALYFYMNSGHVQTEPFRQGLHGPYAMTFSRTGTPKVADINMDFFGSLDIKDYVAASGRGTVSGTALGIADGFQKVLHWYNDQSQYWTYASATGVFESPPMRPGTYRTKLYQDEFLVASASGIKVTAGVTTVQTLASTVKAHTTIWQIGDWDGQPTGFRNADNQLRMHPSDSRMSAWGPLTYSVGTSTLNDIPMALIKEVNSLTIKFNLASTQTGAATLRIGTTLAFSNGRPQAKINDFTGPAPAAPVKIDSRGFTRGAYRGHGEVYDVAVPAGTLKGGANTIVIDCISGNAADGFLGPNFVCDPRRQNGSANIQ